jgi:hypothetical protein
MELARLTPGPAFLPSQSFGYYAQRLVTKPWLRRFIVAGLRSGIRIREGPLRWESPVTADEASSLRSLRELGYAPLQTLLSAEQVLHSAHLGRDLARISAAIFAGRHVAAQRAGLEPDAAGRSDRG